MEKNQELKEELVITDPKRRRTYIGEKENNNTDGLDLINIGLSKNLYGAGPRLQAHHMQ